MVMRFHRSVAHVKGGAGNEAWRVDVIGWVGVREPNNIPVMSTRGFVAAIVREKGGCEVKESD